jgi:hypothetical protein
VRTPGITKDQDVIEEHQDKHSDEVVEDVVHESLECCRCIGEAERHDQKLKMAVVRAKRSLLLIGRLHAHLVVPTVEVELGEEAGATELVEEFIHHRNWKHVADRLGVERAVVHAKASRPVLLFDQQHQR